MSESKEEKILIIKKDLKTIPLSGLFTMQQIVELGSQTMINEFQMIVDEHNKNPNVSERFLKEFEDELEDKMEYNLMISQVIEQEFLRRTKTVFPQITTDSIKEKIRKRWTKEKEYYEKLPAKNKDNKKSEKAPFKMEVSRKKRKEE